MRVRFRSGQGDLFRGRLLVIALAYLLSGAAWLSLPPASHAQSILSGGRIADLRVEGTQRIEAATVRSYMRVNPGHPFDPVRIDDPLKNHLATQNGNAAVRESVGRNV